MGRRRLLHLAGGVAAGLVSPAGSQGERPLPVDADAAGPVSGPVRLFLCGDVMTGRGIDQVLPHSVDPRLYESYVTSAREYVALAERASGPIPQPVDHRYVWGDALAELDRVGPDVRVINLETAITADGAPAPKGINYRMHPGNVPVLTVAGVDACVLANNHVLDWGEAGLEDTLAALEAIGLPAAGAGRDLAEAAAPVMLPVPGRGRVLVFAFGVETSGVPRAWAAAADRPGVNLLPDLSARTVERIAAAVEGVRRPGDVVVASIHWGPNWGYEVPQRQQGFARGLIDAGAADAVHGHSAHHAKAIEVYRDRPILYGCGDFINDYEGISGYEEYRDDLSVMYFPRFDSATGALLDLHLTPLQIRRFRLHHASAEDTRWLQETLDRESRPFGTRVLPDGEGRLMVAWG